MSEDTSAIACTITWTTPGNYRQGAALHSQPFSQEESHESSNVILINAIVAGLFGLAFVLVPGSLTELYGIELTDGGLYVGRLLGAAFLMFAVVTWGSRDAQDSTARQAIVLALFVGFVVGFVVSLVGQLNDIVNALGWTTVAIYLLFSVAYGYFQFRQPETS